MPRVKFDWRTGGKESYADFKHTHKDIKLSFEEWKTIIYGFNEAFRDYLLESGEKGRLPSGTGEFAIIKRERTTTKIKDGKPYINLPIDWKKTKEKGKRIYNFNFHTEGYFFGWKWFKRSSRAKFKELWYFKANRTNARMLAHYLNVDKKYQHIYKEWRDE